MKKFPFPAYMTGIFGLCLTFALSSCSDSDGYGPGALTPEGVVGAYFDSNNTTEFILTPQEESIELTISRKDTSEAAVVPITVVSKDTAAIQVPESVAFAAGDSTQTLTIGIKGLNEKKEYAFKLAIGESAADHYTQQNGTTTFKGSVIVSQWKKLKDEVSFSYYQNDNLPETESEFWQLDGINRFYFSDFLGSGTKMIFSIKSSDFNPDVDSTWVGEIVPSQSEGVVTFDYSTYKMHYVTLGMDDAGEYVYNWSVDNVAISSFGWYGGYDYSSSSWFNLKDSTKKVYLSGYIESDKYTGYVKVYGNWE